MKKLGKVLAMVLALCMTACVFAVSTFAADRSKLPDPAMEIKKLANVSSDVVRIGDNVNKAVTAPLRHANQTANQVNQAANNAKAIVNHVTDAGDTIAHVVAAPLEQANRVGNAAIEAVNNVNELTAALTK